MITFLLEDIIDFHNDLEQNSIVSAGIRDKSLIESAVNAPFQTFDNMELYPTVEEKAARLGFSLTNNHAFVDGNKRIGMYVLLTFLETNGIKLRPTNAEVARVGLAVAAGEMKYQELLDWILENET